MITEAPVTRAPSVTRSSAPPGAPPLPGSPGALPTRRALLGLLATAGATAAALPLSGSLLERIASSPSRLDPASALRISVTGLTTDDDRSAAARAHGGHASQPAVPAATADATDALGARVWSRLVTVGLVVRNTAPGDVLFSPGQVRLRLADGTGVMPVESERRAGAIPGLTTIRTWVRFLAPQDGSAVSVDYTPAGATDRVPLPVVHGAVHGQEGTR